VRNLAASIVLARLVLESARARNESRGGHFKPQFEARDDAGWLRTTLAAHGEGGAPRFVRTFEYACAGKTIAVSDEIDTSLLPVRPRKEP
jgi:succinate dehydrogenase / fumarate reductase flavoprotein subunit